MGLGFGFSACDDDTFECTSDAQCVTDEREGVCQPNGWCSFLDPDCPSLYRYGELAPAHIANTCVPVEVVEGGTGLPEPPDSGSGGADTRSVSEPSDSTSTTGAGDESPVLDEGSSAGDDSFDAGSSSDGAGTSSGGDGEAGGETQGETHGGAESSDDGAEGGEAESGDPPPPPPPPPPECDPALFDDFDDGMVDNILTWHRWSDANTSLNESGTTLSFEMGGGVAAGSDTGIATRDPFDLTSGYVRIKIDEAPPLDTPMRLYLQILASEVCKLAVHVEDNIAWVEDDGPGLFGTDTEWFQLRTDGVSQYVERSVDGVVWENVVDPAPLSCDFSSADVLVFGGVGGPGGAGLSTSIDSIEVCLE